MTNVAKATIADSHDDVELPDWWDFDEDGSAFTLTFERMDAGKAKGREKPVALAVGKVNGQQRSVWLWPESALFYKFRDERQRRGGDIWPGERIYIERGAEKVPSRDKPGQSYWPYKVRFLDAPAVDQDALFGTAAELRETATVARPDDDDVASTQDALQAEADERDAAVSEAA